MLGKLFALSVSILLIATLLPAFIGWQESIDNITGQKRAVSLIRTAAENYYEHQVLATRCLGGHVAPSIAALVASKYLPPDIMQQPFSPTVEYKLNQTGVPSQLIVRLAYSSVSDVNFTVHGNAVISGSDVLFTSVLGPEQDSFFRENLSTQTWCIL